MLRSMGGDGYYEAFFPMVNDPKPWITTLIMSHINVGFGRDVQEGEDVYEIGFLIKAQPIIKNDILYVPLSYAEGALHRISYENGEFVYSKDIDYGPKASYLTAVSVDKENMIYIGTYDYTSELFSRKVFEGIEIEEHDYDQQMIDLFKDVPIYIPVK